MKTIPKMLTAALLLGLVTLVAAPPLWAVGATNRTAAPSPGTQVETLRGLAGDFAAEAESARTPAFRELAARARGPQGALNADRDLKLVGFDRSGLPRFLGVHNLNAARTVSTTAVWPGGSSGYDLDGANAVGELAIWDAGYVRLTHNEFGSRVSKGDAASSTHYHATHVAGTMVASGYDAGAKGMSPAAYLVSYDWTNDESEMASAAAGGLLVSNHSYGYVAGWDQSGVDPFDWYWYGDVALDPDQDPGFGFYYYNARDMDEIAHNAPYYLIVKSAGNDRNDSGPAVGEGHWYWDPGTGDWAWSTVARAADGDAGGYDTVPYGGTAKNILTVGSCSDITGGYSSWTQVISSSFSGWGPTDDGRIKPDIVANGLSLRSSMDDSDYSYAYLSGTSMASPNASGSIRLLAQFYRAMHGEQPARSATIKALVVHTADEASANPGPDYSFGWGLLNAHAAADLVHADSTDTDRIVEGSLTNGGILGYPLHHSGVGPLRVTLAWNDPAGTVPAWSVDPAGANLVNDLDLRVIRMSDGTSFEPWTLDPANPSAAATTGDNVRDNVEQVYIDAPAAGDYTILLTHKGTLSLPQAYSLIQTGLEDVPQTPAVENLAFAQRRDGSGLVDVTFDLVDGDSPSVTVTLEASSDGGAAWDLTVATVSGDVGPFVAPGTGKTIVWDFAADNPGLFLPGCVLRVSADDGTP